MWRAVNVHRLGSVLFITEGVSMPGDTVQPELPGHGVDAVSGQGGHGAVHRPVGEGLHQVRSFQ